MATRFTEDQKWSDKWFRGLKPVAKLVFIYLADNCNRAGFIEIDPEAIAFSTGCDIEDVEGAIKGLERGIIGANDGSDWIWLRNFIKHQRNLPLNKANPAHRNIICLLNEQVNRFDVDEINRCLGGAYMGLDSSISISISKGKGKSRGKEGRKSFESIESIESVESIESGGDQKKGKGVPRAFLEVYPDEREFVVEFLKNPKYRSFDAGIYYEKCKNWSAEGNRKIDWIGTAHNMAIRDETEGKAAYSKSSQARVIEEPVVVLSDAEKWDILRGYSNDVVELRESLNGSLANVDLSEWIKVYEALTGAERGLVEELAERISDENTGFDRHESKIYVVSAIMVMLKREMLQKKILQKEVANGP